MLGAGILNVHSEEWQRHLTFPFVRAGYGVPQFPLVFSMEYGVNSTELPYRAGASIVGVCVGAKLFRQFGLEASLHALTQWHSINVEGGQYDEVGDPGQIFPVFSILFFPYKTSSIALGVGTDNSWRISFLIQLTGYDEKKKAN